MDWNRRYKLTRIFAFGLLLIQSQCHSEKVRPRPTGEMESILKLYHEILSKDPQQLKSIVQAGADARQLNELLTRPNAEFLIQSISTDDNGPLNATVNIDILSGSLQRFSIVTNAKDRNQWEARRITVPIKSTSRLIEIGLYSYREVTRCPVNYRLNIASINGKLAAIFSRERCGHSWIQYCELKPDHRGYIGVVAVGEGIGNDPELKGMDQKLLFNLGETTGGEILTEWKRLYPEIDDMGPRGIYFQRIM